MGTQTGPGKLRCLATSLSGHDKNHLFLIIKEEGDFVFLANGTTKTLDNPKKKNKKHIQIIKKLPYEVSELVNKDDIKDLEVKRAIKLMLKESI